MKTIRYFILIILLLAQYQTQAQQDDTKAINQVLQAYFGVEKALVNDNSGLANKEAKGLAHSIEQVKSTQLSAEQKNSIEKLGYNAQHISESKSIDHQREHFASLSDAIYALVKSAKIQTTVYRQYCPMKKQYWLNPTAAIQNPYYGKQMLDCGKVTETIKGSD